MDRWSYFLRTVIWPITGVRVIARRDFFFQALSPGAGVWRERVHWVRQRRLRTFLAEATEPARRALRTHLLTEGLRWMRSRAILRMGQPVARPVWPLQN